MVIKQLFHIALFAASAVLATSPAQASLITDDFESGNMNGWSVFTTSNGTLGDLPAPQFAQFDVDGNGVTTNSLQMSVGYVSAPCAYPGYDCPRPNEGGGIQQTVYVQDGSYTFGASVASQNTSLYGGYNIDGATFSLMLDGVVLDSVNFGEITTGIVEREQLSFTGILDEGLHVLQILVTRTYVQSDSLFQYIDSIGLSATPAAVPVPSALMLGTLGMLFVARFTRRKRK